MLTAIPRYGARVTPNTEQTIKALRARGRLVQGPAIAEFERQHAKLIREVHDTRDLVVDQDGLIHVYNGTANPVLTSFDPSSPAYSNHSLTGWSQANVEWEGGVSHTSA